MKATRHADLFTWNVFQPDRNIDFNGFYWRRPEGGVLIDPMPLPTGEVDWLAEQPGGVKTILVTNVDHLRAAPELAERLGARIFAPTCDRGQLPDSIDGWFDPDTPLPAELNIEARWIRGGKTEFEAVLHLPALDAVFFGDAVRSHASGVLRLLPEPKVQDAAQLGADVRALADLSFSVVLLGDGDSLFTGAREAFERLLASLPPG